MGENIINMKEKEDAMPETLGHAIENWLRSRHWNPIITYWGLLVALICFGLQVGYNMMDKHPYWGSVLFFLALLLLIAGGWHAWRASHSIKFTATVVATVTFGVGDYYWIRSLNQPVPWMVRYVVAHVSWVLVLILACLLIAFFVTRERDTNIGPEVKTKNVGSVTNDSLMPVARPRIFPVRYGGTADRRFGLFLRNDGDAAFDVTIESGTSIGTSRLEFLNQFSVLTSDKGEVLSESHIRSGNGAGMSGNGLMAEMAKFEIEYLLAKITYRDVDNHWYVTDVRLERDVEERGSGIAAKFIAQHVTTAPKQESSLNTAEIPVPDVALTWELPDEKKGLRGLDPELEKDILVHNRSNKYVYNIRIEKVPLHHELAFDLINEIAPGKYHPTLGRWDGASSLTTKWAHYFCSQRNAEVALKRGWVFDKSHPRGLSNQFLKIPMVVTYECDGSKYLAEFDFIFDIGDESHFLKKSARRV